MVCKGSSSKPKNSNTASTPRRAPAAAAAAAAAAAVAAAANVEEIFDISELLETPEPLVTPERYVQPYMVVVDPAVANEQEEKVVTNPLDTGKNEVNQLDQLRKELCKEKKNDLEGVARQLAGINRSCQKVEDDRVNKKS